MTKEEIRIEFLNRRARTNSQWAVLTNSTDRINDRIADLEWAVQALLELEEK
jgi:hypothetical protein